LFSAACTPDHLLQVFDSKGSRSQNRHKSRVTASFLRLFRHFVPHCDASEQWTVISGQFLSGPGLRISSSMRWSGEMIGKVWKKKISHGIKELREGELA
jgi:hypothetical protein